MKRRNVLAVTKPDSCARTGGKKAVTASADTNPILRMSAISAMHYDLDREIMGDVFAPISLSPEYSAQAPTLPPLRAAG